MSDIFLSFSEHLDKTSYSKNDFYNISLNEQFELLQKRIPLGRQSSSLRNFIETCFPSGMKKNYYLSCPNFLREKKQNKEGKVSYLNNVVIRPELTLSMRRILPDNQNVILIGDIYEGGKLKMLQVKGIQFIDSSMSSPNDMIANEAVCNSFIRGEWSSYNVDFNDTFFTPNKVLELIETCYTVKNPEYIRRTYEEWNKYIEFRKYYLDEQSKRNFKLDSAEYVDAYAVNRKDYRKNSSIYDDYILDGIKDFTKGEMVVLSSKIADAEAFPLVRLNIDRNKKQFNESRIFKRGQLINDEERKIRSLASDNVFITSLDPDGDSKFKDKEGHPQKVQFSELLNLGYALGDRFRIVSFDIVPQEHLNQLDMQYDSDIDEGNKIIDLKYEKIIKDELDKAVAEFEKEITLKVEATIDLKKKKLDSQLDTDVKANSDANILNQIKKIKDEIQKKASLIKKDKKENDKDFRKRVKSSIEEEYKKINVRVLYEKRNNEELNKFSKIITENGKKEIEIYKNKKTLELKNKYKDDIKNEKIILKEKLDDNLKKDKEKAIDEETIIRFSLYFRLGDSNNNITGKQIKTINECKYIVYDNRAEKAKISRQELALNNFYSGFVKNPYLSTYLFNPETLSNVQPDYSDWVWYLDSLNEKQKEAVRKAVSSNGIFLLQGPPGTGKTQVIAETVAQLVKKGKKVLISSETHKAIDNVFERLPKIADIVPIRLIPSNNNRKNDNEYDPKFLVDNFYKNVSSHMTKSIERYKNFKRNKEELVCLMMKFCLLIKAWNLRRSNELFIF